MRNKRIVGQSTKAQVGAVLDAISSAEYDVGRLFTHEGDHLSPRVRRSLEKAAAHLVAARTAQQLLWHKARR